MCLAGCGNEVITFDPMYTTYPATIEVYRTIHGRGSGAGHP